MMLVARIASFAGLEPSSLLARFEARMRQRSLCLVIQASITLPDDPLRTNSGSWILKTVFYPGPS